MEHRKQISLEQFDAIIKNSSRRIFRVESLTEYNVPGDRAVFNHFVCGVPFPDLSPTSSAMQWFSSIKSHRERGVEFHRLRIMPERITSYLRYEIEWCYSYSQMYGEETRIQKVKASPDPLLIDFYSVDDTQVIYIDYSDSGAWSGFSLETDTEHAQKLIAHSKDAWAKAISLKDFLSEYRKRSV